MPQNRLWWTVVIPGMAPGAVPDSRSTCKAQKTLLKWGKLEEHHQRIDEVYAESERVDQVDSLTWYIDTDSQQKSLFCCFLIRVPYSSFSGWHLAMRHLISFKHFPFKVWIENLPTTDFWLLKTWVKTLSSKFPTIKPMVSQRRAVGRAVCLTLGRRIEEKMWVYYLSEEVRWTYVNFIKSWILIDVVRCC